MGGLAVFITLTLLAICHADVSVVPPVRCGYMPNGLYKCIATPRIVQPSVAAQCDRSLPECEKITCVFRKSGWMDGDKLDKTKLTEYFEQFAVDNPDWQLAVNNLKAGCLQGDLPAQSIHLNCPAFDAMQCSFAYFIRYAPPSLWSSDESCQAVRQYAANCPVCPSDCFASQIPIGTCNACQGLPKAS